MTTLRSLVRTGIFVAGLAVLAAPALSSPAGVPPYDGAPDPTLNPPGGAPPFWAAIPGLFDFGVDLGGGSPYTNVDTAAAESAVRAAMDVIDAADLGDEDAELAVGDALDHDLAWYATQELPFLLELL